MLVSIASPSACTRVTALNLVNLALESMPTFAALTPKGYTLIQFKVVFGHDVERLRFMLGHSVAMLAAGVHLVLTLMKHANLLFRITVDRTIRQMMMGPRQQELPQPLRQPQLRLPPRPQLRLLLPRQQIPRLPPRQQLLSLRPQLRLLQHRLHQLQHRAVLHSS